METRDSETGDSIRRRRRCNHCQQRFTTYERIEPVGQSVVKSDGSREDYLRDKLAASLKLALRKRPVPSAAVEQAILAIEAALNRAGREVPSARIGELVMEQLRVLDHVAYIRYASVYRNFADAEAFASAVAEVAPPAAVVTSAAAVPPATIVPSAAAVPSAAVTAPAVASAPVTVAPAAVAPPAPRPRRRAGLAG